MLKNFENLKIKIFADGANIKSILDLNGNEYISGFTTNPTLMKKAGIKDYSEFAKTLLLNITDKPISFEVFDDDIEEMRKQAIKISSWSNNVNVKIPITNTKGESTINLIKDLSEKNIKCNVTAIFTINQCLELLKNIDLNSHIILSVFAGRIADTGIDPIPIMEEIVAIAKDYKFVEILWASPRELLNIFHADYAGCDIITVPNDIINKFDLINKNLNKFSLETVEMFYKDAIESGFSI